MRPLALSIALLALTQSTSGCASGTSRAASASSGPHGAAPAGYVLFTRMEDNVGSLFMVRGDGSDEQRVLEGSLRGHWNVDLIEPPHHLLIGISAHNPRLCPACDGRTPHKRFRFDVRTSAFEPVPQPPPGCRPTPEGDRLLCIPGPSNQKPSEIVLRDPSGARSTTVLSGLLWPCEELRDGGAAVADLRALRLYGVSARGDVTPLANELVGTCKPASPWEYTRHQAPAPAPSMQQDTPRVVFQGAPSSGGKRGLYTATLDGKETLLITTDPASFLTSLPGGVAAIEPKPDSPDHPSLVVIDPRRSVEPIHRWDDASLRAVTPSGRLVIASALPPYAISTVKPDGADVVKIADGGGELSLTLATRDGYLIFLRGHLPSAQGRAALSVPEAGGAPVVLAPSHVFTDPMSVGGRIVFVEKSPGLRAAVVSIKPDGADRRVLLSLEGGDIHEMRSSPRAEGWVVVNGREDSDSYLYVAHVEGNGLQRVAQGSFFQGFLPDRAPPAAPARPSSSARPSVPVASP